MGEMFYEGVGFRIRYTRTMQKMTQAQLGEKIGRGKQTVQRYEEGTIKIPAETIIDCAKALNTSVSYLCGEENAGVLNNFSRQGLLVASEIMALPDNSIRKSVYHLVRDINRISGDNDNTPD